MAHGYRDTPHGPQAYVSVSGQKFFQRFPPHTPIREMQAWRAEMRQRFRRLHAMRGTFAADAERYLAAVKAMPSYADRDRHVQWWIAQFGDRPRRTIRADEIRAALATLHAAGKAASTINHHRTALQHLYTVLDGKSTPNPVKDAPKYREPDAEPRGVPFALLTRVIDAMRPSQTRARLMVMLWTGLPHASLKRIEPQHLNPDAPSVYVPGRQKGKGTRARVLPLSAEGLAAFRELATWDAFGPFSNSAMHSAWDRACVRVFDAATEAQTATPELAAALARLTPYDLRHSYATDMYGRTGDIRATQAALGHSTPKLTERYTLAAVDPRLLAAVQALAEGRKLPRRVPNSRKTPRSR